MRWSYIVFLISGLLIIADKLLHLIPSVSYKFLGLPGALGGYLGQLTFIAFYISLLGFATAVYKALPQNLPNGNPISDSAENSSPDPSLIAGIALSAFCSVFFVIVLAIHRGDLPKQSLWWLLFVLVTGLLISSKKPMALAYRILLSTIPALAFVLYAIGLLVLALLLGEGIVISGPTGAITIDDVAKYGLIAAVIGLASIPAIACASIARDSIFAIITATSRLSPELLGQLKSNISLMLGIFSLIAVAILGVGLGGADAE